MNLFRAMERNDDLVRVGELMPTTVDEILKQLDEINLDGMAEVDKVRLYQELTKKFGIDSQKFMQMLGGSQMIGNTIQFNICDSSALPALIDSLTDKLGKEVVVELIKVLLDKI